LQSPESLDNSQNTVISNVATYDHQRLIISLSPSISFDITGAMGLSGAFTFSTTYDKVAVGKNRYL